MALARLSAGFQLLSLLPTIKLVPSGAAFRVDGWACACSRPLWVSPTTSPVRLGVSPAATSTPKGVFIQRFEALFPGARALGCSLLHSPTIPPGLSVCECGATGSVSCCTACPIPHQLPSCRESSPPQLPISATPAGLDECFFFISLVVGLP